MELLKIGDLVKLKSGGRVMTVTNTKSAEIICQWFYKGDVKLGHFPPESLIRVDRRGSQLLV